MEMDKVIVAFESPKAVNGSVRSSRAAGRPHVSSAARLLRSSGL